jgi:hypothetical protein
MVKVAEPVLGMFSATTMPSVGRMSPLVWILTVTVLEGGRRLAGVGLWVEGEDEGDCSPAGWVAPGEGQWLAGLGLDASGGVVDDVAAATLRGCEGRKGKDEWDPGTHVDAMIGNWTPSDYWGANDMQS